MIFNINNNIYLEVGDFVKLGVKPSLIKKWTNYHNQKRNNGKNSDYWLSIAHPDHGKKILIRYNSLPEKFQIKYSLPTEEEIKQDQAVNKFEEVEAKKTSEIQIIREALKECLSKKYLEYYPEYLLKFSGDKKRAANYARNHSIFSYLVDLFSSVDQTILKIAFDEYIKLDMPSKCFILFLSSGN